MSRDSTRALITFWPWSDDEHATASVLQEAVAAAGSEIPVLRPQRHNGGLAAWLEEITAAHPGVDVVLIADAVALPGGWLERLSTAAHSDDAVAAATVRAEGEAPDDTGAAATPPPRVLTPAPHCTLLRHTALQLVGGLDPELPHPAALLADFAARAQEQGLSCVLVPGLVAGRPGDGLGPCPEDQRVLLAGRHRWLDAARADEAALGPGPLKRALLAARSAREQISVTVDARALGNGVGGTQTYVASLVLALAESRQVTVRAVVAGPADPELAAAFADAGVETIDYERAAAGQAPRSDVVHRPQQVFTPSDLLLLDLLGDRLVISHMDLIGYRTPTYHASVEEWRAYRRSTRAALAAADRVIFFSEHARRDALAEELVGAERAAIAGIGVVPAAPELARRRPASVPEGRSLLLALGSDYAHKNRVFALRLVEQLRVRHGWDGVLVLAGAHVRHGSSAAAERALLDSNPELAAHVLNLGPVDDAEKRWLIEHAVAHLAPSSYEGFGLAPLEAAAAGRPCVYAAWTSLSEIIDPAAATIVPWDSTASADAAAALLVPGAERERHLRLLGDALHRYRWESVIGEIVAAYREALVSPFRAAAPRALEELQREQARVELQAAVAELQGSADDLRSRVRAGLPLIDARGSLLTTSQQRGLMRVASRRWLRGPLLGPFGLLGVDRSRLRKQPEADARAPDAAS